jgi:hypothetical protein
MRCIAGCMLSSALASDLDGRVLRSLTRGAGGTQGHDRFSSFSSRVFSAFLEALSSNFKFPSARDVKGIFCNMYVPRVMD